MQITCPNCKAPIAPNGVDVAKGEAYCAPCGRAFALAAVASAPVRRAAPAQPRSVVTRAGDRIAVALPPGGFKGAGCFMFFFSAFWNCAAWTLFGATFFALHRTGKSAAAAVHSGMNLFTVLFLIPFLVIGLITAVITVYCIWGDSAVAMDRSTVLFERRVFGRKWTKTFALEDVADIRRTESYRQNDVPVDGVGIHFKSRRGPLTFGTALPEDEKDWLIGELYAFWSGSDVRRIEKEQS